MQHSDVQKQFLNGSLTCVDWVQSHLEKIENHQDLNVFLEVFGEEALSIAKSQDLDIKQGKIKPLTGMVVGIKDLFCYKNHKVEAASKILKDFTSQFSATCVERLIDEGAIIIGRQNCDEFAMGSSNENSAFGNTKNGIDPTRVPGGSSGASAVAVQMGMCQVSLGTDTGGSIRQPAAFSGIIGMKPTYSRISRYGIVAYASSFDVIGILSRSIEDNALVLGKIAGEDARDSTCARTPIGDYSIQSDLKSKESKKIAYLDEMVNHPDLNPRVREAFFREVACLKEQGHKVSAISSDYLDYLLPVYYILTTAEASSNLARFDGVRYGYRADGVKDLESLYKCSRTEGFGDEVRQRILLGTYVLSADYYDAYYLRAQKARRKIKEVTENILTEYDFLMSPTTGDIAFKLGAKQSDPISMYLEDLFTVQASVAGLPAISVPMKTTVEGMPLGVQFIAPMFEEGKLYNFANDVMLASGAKEVKI